MAASKTGAIIAWIVGLCLVVFGVYVAIRYFRSAQDRGGTDSGGEEVVLGPGQQAPPSLNPTSGPMAQCLEAAKRIHRRRRRTRAEAACRQLSS